MDLDSFLVSLYVLTENWWKATHAPADARVGRPSLISDPEILTLAILAQWPRFRSERDFHRFAEAHLREYFPTLPSQSQFNRRARAFEAEALSLHLARTLAEEGAVYHVLDTTLIPAVVRVRACRRGLFAGQATFGRSASKKERLEDRVGLRLQGRPLGHSGGCYNGLLPGGGLRRRAVHRRDPHPQRPPRSLSRRQGLHLGWVGAPLDLGVRGFGGRDPQGQLQEGVGRRRKAVGDGKAADRRGDHKPAQGPLLPGAPPGEDPRRAPGSPGGE